MSFTESDDLSGPTLPTISTVSPRTPENSSSSSPLSERGVGSPQRGWSSIFSGLKRIDPFQRRKDSGETAVSSHSDKTLCPETGAETENGMLGKAGEQGNHSQKVDNDPVEGSGKPEKGTVWDIWPIMPKNVRRWHKPAR